MKKKKQSMQEKSMVADKSKVNMEDTMKTTTEKYLDSLDTAGKKRFYKELRNLALSEMVLASMAKDEISVRKLAKIANVSPTIIQEMRSGKRNGFSLKSFLKVLDSLGFKILLEREGDISELDISSFTK